MNKTVGIILGAAQVNNSLIPIFGEIPSTLIPINGKPSVYYIIQKMVSMNIYNIYISVGFKKNKVINYINSLDIKKAKVTFIEVETTVKPGSALLTIIKKVIKKEKNISVFVNLADTLIFNEQPLSLQEDFVLCSTDYDFSDFWCVCSADNAMNIANIYDKQANKDNCYALTGIYHFLTPELFEKHNDSNDIEISELLTYYKHKGHQIKITQIEQWFDLGHLNKYQQAKKNFLTSRTFNHLSYNSLLGTITKKSKNELKLIDEICWYQHIPQRLQALTPKIIESNLKLGEVSVELEYYGYPPLSELWIYGEFNNKIWEVILNKLMDILLLFKSYKEEISLHDYENMYRTKTMERIKTITEDKVLAKLFSYEEIFINNQKYAGWNKCAQLLEKEIANLYHKEDNCVIHGDFCFSNILYDLMNGVVRLIDPRGSWGKSKVGGDIKYDIAKLRHSVSGLYDFIVNDLYVMDYSHNKINIEFPFLNPSYVQVEKYFDKKISDFWDLRQIKFIEGLLFISMIPLHSENKHRQIAMFSRGITLLNSLF
jgi:dTDP-glucose pyrophosphorylase